MCTACALATFSSIVIWRTSGISSKFLFPLLYHMWQRHFRRAYWQFDLVFFFAVIIYIVVVFILLIDCLKLLPRKVSILMLESDSTMYSVTRLNQFLKYVAVLHLLVFLMCIGLLFIAEGLFAFPTVFLPSSFLISLVDTFYLKVCRNFVPDCEPFSCHTV